MEIDFSGRYTNEQNCKHGDRGVTLSEPTLEIKTSKDGEKYNQYNIEVEINGKKLIHSPRIMEGRRLQEAWGTDSKMWVGREFEVVIVVSNSYGSLKKRVELQPIK